MFISPKDAATCSALPPSSFDCICDDVGTESCSCAYALPLTSTPCDFCPSTGGVVSFRAAAADSIFVYWRGNNLNVKKEFKFDFIFEQPNTPFTC